MYIYLLFLSKTLKSSAFRYSKSLQLLSCSLYTCLQGMFSLFSKYDHLIFKWKHFKINSNATAAILAERLSHRELVLTDQIKGTESWHRVTHGHARLISRASEETGNRIHRPLITCLLPPSRLQSIWPQGRIEESDAHRMPRRGNKVSNRQIQTIREVRVWPTWRYLEPT